MAMMNERLYQLVNFLGLFTLITSGLLTVDGMSGEDPFLADLPIAGSNFYKQAAIQYQEFQISDLAETAAIGDGGNNSEDQEDSGGLWNSIWGGIQGISSDIGLVSLAFKFFNFIILMISSLILAASIVTYPVYFIFGIFGVSNMATVLITSVLSPAIGLTCVFVAVRSIVGFLRGN